jgi:putative tryptophan/tyrosine transport system substrate-binding protein
MEKLAARELGLQLHSMEVSSVDRFESAFKEATQARSGALVMTANPLFTSNQKTIGELATKNRMPSIYNRGGEDSIASGGLMSPATTGPNNTGAPLSIENHGRRSAQNKV